MYTGDDYCMSNAGKWCADNYIKDYDLTEDKMGCVCPGTGEGIYRDDR